MKAKSLAEQLLKHPDFDVEFDVCTKRPTYDSPYLEYESFRIVGADIDEINKVVILEYDEVEV